MSDQESRVTAIRFKDLLPTPRPSVLLTPAGARTGAPRLEEQLDSCGCAHRESETLTPQCYKDIVAPTTGNTPTLGFEFDLNYGASTVNPPLSLEDPGWGATVFSLEGKNITTHRVKRDGFRLEGDGNRIEIGTKPFEITPEGRAEMQDVMKKVLTLVDDLKSRCKAAPAATSLGYPSRVGAPHPFTPPYLEAGVACVFPLAFNRTNSYFASGCALGASPQVTFELPLARVDELVGIIETSEKEQVAGLALSGPPGRRQGVRSVALYQARKAVNDSRNAHLQAHTPLAGSSVVSKTNFTPTLQGLLILMVSYLKSGELTYGPKDYEIFAKAYLPLNVKNPFRLLFGDLSGAEQRVFAELYNSPRTKLWQLAKPGATAADGGNTLFPAKVHSHQTCWFDPPPTWNDFVEKTVNNTPLLRTESCPGKDKKGEDPGCEVLFAPLSRILPHEVGSRRVTVELRRLGHNWVFSHPFEADGLHHPGWAEMTETLFDMALSLNR